MFDIVGKTSKFLFGTLDSDDAEKYDTALRILNTNLNSISKEAVLQVSLTKHLIKNYNDSISTLNNNQQLIKTKINQFQDDVYGHFDNIEAYISAQNTLDQIILNCQNLIDLINNIENAVTFASLNSIHSSVVSANDYKQIIKTLETIYNKNQTLHFNSIHSYYKITNSKVYFHNNRIIFTIQLPVLLAEKFQYFHLYPIPQNNATIIPPNPILILGSKTHQYEEENCKDVEKMYICHDKLSPNRDDCVIPIIRNEKPNNCVQTPINIAETLVERISDNFALIIPSKDNIRIKKNCNSPGYIMIEDPSLINIPHNCEISNEKFKISNKENSIIGEPFLFPGIIASRKNPQKHTHLNVKKVKLDDIVKLYKELSKMNQKPIIVHSESVNWLNYLIIIMFLILIVIASGILIKRKIAKRKKYQNPNC